MLLGMMQKRPDATVIVGGPSGPGDSSLSERIKMIEEARDEAFGQYHAAFKSDDIQKSREAFKTFHELEHYLMDMQEEMIEED